jgi:sulfite reductase alpha subunit-like flavoprotein
MESSSDKETIHVEFDLTGSEITYTCGDALGIYPLNDSQDVDDLIDALNAPPVLPVPVPQFSYSPRPKGESMHLREALIKYYDLKHIKLDLVKCLIESVTDNAQKEKGNALLKEGVGIIFHSSNIVLFFVIT